MFKSKFTRTLFGTISLLLPTLTIDAKEGMWPPSVIKSQEAEMQRLGMKITAEELYNEQATGLNMAVVHFGGGCTGEFVSDKGLIFTNHHCAYYYGQFLSSPEKNFLETGFFAQNMAEELPCNGLTIKIVKKIENVSSYILRQISDTLSEGDRKSIIEERIALLTKAYTRMYNAEVEIKPFFEGNEYWATIRETFSDVRMVVFPPNGIGKFGADTDNWMWPRQSGDFAVLRVYADANNKPAAYSPENKPYKPVKFFPISTQGVKEGDFTMVYGFPGRTTQYLSSYQVDQVQRVINPIRIDARTLKLNAWDTYMRSDKKTFLKYASKQATVANGWKKWQGEVLGLQEKNVVAQKETMEQKYLKTVANSANPTDRLVLWQLEANVKGSNNFVAARELHREAILGIEAIQQTAVLQQVMDIFRSPITTVELRDTLSKIKNRMKGFYNNYLPHVDQTVFEKLLPYYLSKNDALVAPQMRYMYSVYGNDIKRWSNTVYNNSLMTNKDRLFEFLDKATQADSFAIIGDPSYVIYYETSTFQSKQIVPQLMANSKNIDVLNRQYVSAQMRFNPSNKPLYPDANSTLRIAYGQVAPIAQKEGNFFLTDLDMKVKRHNAEIEEFNIPQRLLDLHQRKDYGRWAVNGSVPINFIATNHTTGGNSGSPVLNAKGELIGINFDRIWQGTMSDIYFDESFCRNISVDVRYVLFIIEKYGNAGWLLNEMKLMK